ncbi:MAG: hypothetical protein KQ78_02195 [Candidatus Izimaplasma bacterium HR2]|nr:MAG: hypothetical protein KQ78_02195 [Candidatus Izimaplasma bacterium HR2]
MRNIKCVIAGSRSLGLKEINGVLVQMMLDECPFVEEVFTKCEWSCRILEIVSGTAKGIDNLGEQLADKLGLDVVKFPADWSQGKVAGHIRNKDMAKYCDMAIVIMKNNSKGSMNMIEQMKKLNKPCLVYIIRNGEIYEQSN